HLTLQQPSAVPVHVVADVATSDSTGAATAFHGVIDPLPTSIEVDYHSGDGDGAATITRRSADPAPSVAFTVSNHPTAGRPLYAVGTLSGIPDRMQATWSTAGRSK